MAGRACKRGFPIVARSTAGDGVQNGGFSVFFSFFLPTRVLFAPPPQREQGGGCALTAVAVPDHPGP